MMHRLPLTLRLLCLFCMIIFSSACIPDFLRKNETQRPTETVEAEHWISPDRLPLPNKDWTRTQITEVIPQLLTVYPVQVNVVIVGVLQQACEQIEEIDSQYHHGSFQLAVFSANGETCHPENQAFEIIVPLATEQAKAGFYQLEVNGVAEWFELLVDNDL